MAKKLNKKTVRSLFKKKDETGSKKKVNPEHIIKTFCDECKCKFEFNPANVKTEYFGKIEKVQHRYFSCPDCGKKFTMSMLDKESNKIIKERTKLANKIKQLLKVPDFEEVRVEYAELLVADDVLENTIKERSEALKEKWL